MDSRTKLYLGFVAVLAVGFLAGRLADSPSPAQLECPPAPSPVASVSAPTADPSAWCFTAADGLHVGRVEHYKGALLIFDNKNEEFVTAVPAEAEPKLKEAYPETSCK